MNRTRIASAFVIGAVIGTALHAQEPRPATRGETFRDWIVGCDNGGTCRAMYVSDTIEVFIDRSAEPHAIPTITVIPALKVSKPGPASIAIDGRFLIKLTEELAPLELRDASNDQFMSALAAGLSMDLHIGGQIVRASLRGSAAALRYIDEKQGRAGTVTALVARGPRAAETVPQPPALPERKAAPVLRDGKLEPLTADEQRRIRAVTDCGDDGRGDAAEIKPLSPVASLVLAPCGRGPYNALYAVLIATGTAGQRTFEPASFDVASAVRGAPSRLYNAVWNADVGVLSDDYWGNSVSTCGSGGSYVWDGARFRQTSFNSMWECRRRISAERIVLWRATVVRD